mmetsp:Transcript_86991/g.164055  ORF Transcript_86991/g.164055 Transcript_86991/m.164055 type:complete len:146 (-) Transcript_86991:7-444(-)
MLTDNGETITPMTSPPTKAANAGLKHSQRCQHLEPRLLSSALDGCRLQAKASRGGSRIMRVDATGCGTCSASHGMPLRATVMKYRSLITRHVAQEINAPKTAAAHVTKKRHMKAKMVKSTGMEPTRTLRVCLQHTLIECEIATLS